MKVPMQKATISDGEVELNFQVSEEEISFLTQGEDPYDDNVVRKLFHQNLKLLLVTEGPDGCRYYTKVRMVGIVDCFDTCLGVGMCLRVNMYLFLQYV